MASQVLTTQAEIPAGNLLVKIGTSAGTCNLCGASDTPFGVSAGMAINGSLCRVDVLEDKVYPLVAAGAITQGSVVQLAASGRVATYTDGTIVGRAMSAASAAGDPVDVAVDTATAIGAGGGSVTSASVASAIADYDGDQRAETLVALGDPEPRSKASTILGPSPVAFPQSKLLYMAPLDAVAPWSIIRSGDTRTLNEDITKVFAARTASACLQLNKLTTVTYSDCAASDTITAIDASNAHVIMCARITDYAAATPNFVQAKVGASSTDYRFMRILETGNDFTDNTIAWGSSVVIDPSDSDVGTPDLAHSDRAQIAYSVGSASTTTTVEFVYYAILAAPDEAAQLNIMCDQTSDNFPVLADALASYGMRASFYHYELTPSAAMVARWAKYQAQGHVCGIYGNTWGSRTVAGVRDDVIVPMQEVYLANGITHGMRHAVMGGSNAITQDHWDTLVPAYLDSVGNGHSRPISSPYYYGHLRRYHEYTVANESDISTLLTATVTSKGRMGLLVHAANALDFITYLGATIAPLAAAGTLRVISVEDSRQQWLKYRYA